MGHLFSHFYIMNICDSSSVYTAANFNFFHTSIAFIYIPNYYKNMYLYIYYLAKWNGEMGEMPLLLKFVYNCYLSFTSVTFPNSNDVSYLGAFFVDYP